MNAIEAYVPLRGVRLFVREAGEGPPCIVLHGGPDFDHRYLLPELDRLASLARLVYYDQRGRGSSVEGVEPNSVTIESEVQDLDDLRASLGQDRVALLGHSWGGLLAAEYAARHPERVAHLVLMNSAPISFEDRERMRERRTKNEAAALAGMTTMAATPRFKSGDIAAEAEYYRLHFRGALSRPEDVERIVSRIRVAFTPAGVLKAREIERRLYDQTWDRRGFDLRPALARLRAPTLVLHGRQDFIPLVCAENLARAIPGATLVVLEDCGHFAYLERPDETSTAIAALLRQS